MQTGIDLVRWRRRLVSLAVAALAAGLLVWLWAGPVVSGVRDQRRAGFSFFADAYAWFPEEGAGPGRVEQVSPGDGIYYQPCIRPDGSELVFAGAADGPPRIWLADLATLELRPLTEPDSAALHPAYSWDGTRIAFCSDRDSGLPPMSVERLGRGGQPNTRFLFQIYVMDADGSNVRRVTDVTPSAWRPSFHPNGQSLVYSRSGAGPQALFEVALPTADGTLGEPRMIPGTRGTHRPWFAADGSAIYFHSTGEQHRAHRLPIEGGTREPLENDRFERTHGSFFDPVTSSVLVHARDEGVFGIWELPLGPDGRAAGPARKLAPPGFERAYHATRARNGVIGFDLPRDCEARAEVPHRLRHLLLR